MLKAILMDFDGVIIDTELIYFKVFKEWLKVNNNYEISLQEFQMCIGTGDEILFNYLSKEKNIAVNREQFFVDSHATVMEQSRALPPKAGVVDFIKQVKENGLKLALVTSNTSESPTYHLKRFGLLDEFDHIVTREDVKNVKPSPELYIKALELLNLQPNQAIAIEDSLNGFLAGRAAGLEVIAIPHQVTESLVFEGAYKRLKSLTEIGVCELVSDFTKAI